MRKLQSLQQQVNFSSKGFHQNKGVENNFWSPDTAEHQISKLKVVHIQFSTSVCIFFFLHLFLLLKLEEWNQCTVILCLIKGRQQLYSHILVLTDTIHSLSHTLTGMKINQLITRGWDSNEEVWNAPRFCFPPFKIKAPEWGENSDSHHLLPRHKTRL